MHFLPDTEEADAVAERYWPDSFKQVIQKELRQALGIKLNGGNLRHIHRRRYQDFPDLEQFTARIADMVVVGAENGADEGFDGIYRAFLTESPLPEARRHARYLWPRVFSPRLRDRIHQAVVADYSRDDALQHAYKAGYTGDYGSFEEFINEAARLVVVGVMNGVDDMLAQIYRSLVNNRPLPPARRRPRRLKGW